jgi:2-haloacid dehalogenase
MASRGKPPALPWTDGRGGFVPEGYPPARAVQVGLRYKLCRTLSAGSMTNAERGLPTALLFDVFGTLVDWRTGVIGALRAFGERAGVAADWPAFADDWRRAYAPSMDRVRRGESAWQNLDALHRASLDALLERHAIRGIGGAERERVARAWHELPPWPDAVPGLRRLRERFIVASLSNGNVALQVNLSRHARLPLDMLFSAELFAHYKPDAQTYLGACGLLDLPPGRAMLVAAHADDLAAAKSFGLRTAFVARPFEWGPDSHAETPAADVDRSVDSIEALAEQLGA